MSARKAEVGLIAFVICLVFIPAVFRPVSAAPPDDPLGNSLNARFDVAARMACQERGWMDRCVVTEVTREQLTDDVAHYQVLLSVGDGPFDVIPIHRVVRERTPGVPADAMKTFFFLHGSGARFLGAAVNGGASRIGLYLAERDVDVWGMDTRWTRVPQTYSDVGFMAQWDFDFQVRDILLATRFARHARRLIGGNLDPLTLAGHSLGASLVFAVANAEAALEPNDRDVARIVPMDTIYAVPPGNATTHEFVCANEAILRAQNTNGVYRNNANAGITLGRLALTSPDAPSSKSPLTNRQLALTNASALSFAPAFAYHSYAVVRDSSGVPLDGRYTSAEGIFGGMSSQVQWATATMMDYFAIACGDNAQQHVANLGDVSVPVLYVGFAGGFGLQGEYATTLLGSTDVTTLFIQLMDGDQAKDDWGHSDWVRAADAAALVWDPIWTWIASR
jgi:hypothetical protein